MRKDMTARQMRKLANQYMVKHNVDTIGLNAADAMLLGMEYITIKGKSGIQGINFEEEYVPVPDKDAKTVYDAVRKELEEFHLHELSREEVQKLEKEIVFGSLYMADYYNSFGVKPSEVSNYADGYLEAKSDPDEYGEYDSFYDYIQSIEWTD